MRKNALQKVQQTEKQPESTNEWYDIAPTHGSGVTSSPQKRPGKVGPDVVPDQYVFENV